MLLSDLTALAVNFPMETKMLIRVTAAGLAAAVLLASPVLASEVGFTYRSHEVTTEGGAKVLYARLAKRAKNSCETTDRRPISYKRAEELCTMRLTNELVAEINSPVLAKIHGDAQNKVFIAKAPRSKRARG